MATLGQIARSLRNRGVRRADWPLDVLAHQRKLDREQHPKVRRKPDCSKCGEPTEGGSSHCPACRRARQRRQSVLRVSAATYAVILQAAAREGCKDNRAGPALNFLIERGIWS